MSNRKIILKGFSIGILAFVISEIIPWGMNILAHIIIPSGSRITPIGESMLYIITIISWICRPLPHIVFSIGLGLHILVFPNFFAALIVNIGLNFIFWILLSVAIVSRREKNRAKKNQSAG
ncbi:MAG: hypothetical protein WC546_03380 [Candidatus Omnitrophota bacterium]|nr:hypothetical protein [Candidatus Omnitrophota bacterium]